MDGGGWAGSELLTGENSTNARVTGSRFSVNYTPRGIAVRQHPFTNFELLAA